MDGLVIERRRARAAARFSRPTAQVQADRERADRQNPDESTAA